MAENLRYRQNHQDESHARDTTPDARPAQPAQPAQNDPLAELARLIGQNDPFAEFGRANARAAQAQHSGDAGAPAPEWLNRSGNAGQYQGSAADPYAAPGYEGQDYGDQHYASEQRDSTHYRDDAYAAAPRGGAPEPYVPQDAHGHDSREYDPRDYEAADPRYAAHAVDPYRMDHDGSYQAADEQYADGYYADDENATSEEAPRERSRGGMMTIAAVVGLALIGTAGAFGYRAYTGGSSSSGEPPVIKADPTPSKVPATKSAEAQQPNKLIYDRVGEPTQAERVVPREETPVEVKTTQPPRAIPMAPGAMAAAPQTPAAAAFPPSVNEPKKVRTMPIRPDQPSGSQAAAQPQQQVPAPAPATRQAPAAPQAMAAVEPRAAAPQPRRNDGPMTIAPGSQPAQQPARTAAVNPRAPVAGGYVVQVSSQKSEADAQASYRTLQSRYSKVLSGRDAMIRRVDLGDKGIYYRAQVGPFAGAEQANALCNDLKAAGGACIVQRN
jgi:hypothetical protein